MWNEIPAEVRKHVVEVALDHPEKSQRYRVQPPGDEPALTAHMVALASEYGLYGYRGMTALLQQEGWVVNHKRVERLWR